MRPGLTVILCFLTMGCLVHRDNCLVADTSGDWREERPSNSIDFKVRVPVEFEEEYADDYQFTWMGERISQLAIQLPAVGSDALFDRFPPRDDKPEYRRCQTRISGMPATLITFNQRQLVGDLAYTGPFHLFAEIVLPDGSKVRVFAQTDDRKVQSRLVAAVRSIRFNSSSRAQPRR